MTSTNKLKKKLIEVAIPLEAINVASAREKLIRHGHPCTMHLWWARRPLAACRAVLFSQLVDDPSSRMDELLADPKLRAHAEAELPKRIEAWENNQESVKNNKNGGGGGGKFCPSRPWKMWRSRSSANGSSPSSRIW